MGLPPAGQVSSQLQSWPLAYPPSIANDALGPPPPAGVQITDLPDTPWPAVGLKLALPELPRQHPPGRSLRALWPFQPSPSAPAAAWHAASVSMASAPSRHELEPSAPRL